MWQEQQLLYMKTNIPFDYISLSSSYNEKYLTQNYKTRNTHIMINNFVSKIVPFMR